MRYSKSWLTLDQQIVLLKKRGLVVEDESSAKGFLTFVSFFRLKAYFYSFSELDGSRNFIKGTTFEQLTSAYDFDTELRLIIFGAIEKIEIALRTCIVYSMLEEYGDDFLTLEGVFFNGESTNRNFKNYYSKLQETLNRIHCKDNEDFIRRFKQKYPANTSLPSWMAIELFTFGELSELYMMIQSKDIRTNVANRFNLPYELFKSWLHTLNYVRNICGHHSRLLVKEFHIPPKNLFEKRGQNRSMWLGGIRLNNKRPFFVLCIIKYFLNRIGGGKKFFNELEALIIRYPLVPIELLGINSNQEQAQKLNWQTLPVWLDH